MTEIYVVTILTEEGYEYLKYEGENKDIASKIYEEFKTRKNRFKVSFYKKVIIEEIDKRIKKCDNCGNEVANECSLSYCTLCESNVCAYCLGDNYDDVCRNCES